MLRVPRIGALVIVTHKPNCFGHMHSTGVVVGHDKGVESFDSDFEDGVIVFMRGRRMWCMLDRVTEV